MLYIVRASASGVQHKKMWERRISEASIGDEKFQYGCLSDGNQFREGFEKSC